MNFPGVFHIFSLVVVVGMTTAAHADVITRWNEAALEVIRVNRTPPPTASLALAVMHVAMYDAVNGIDRTHESYFVSSTVPAGASKEAAASAAAHHILSAYFPKDAGSLDRVHTSTLGDIEDGPRKRQGVAWGEQVATQILALRANDGSIRTISPPSGTGLGVWQPTTPGFAAYLLPHWGFVMPFATPSGSTFRPAGPPPLDSAEYLEDLAEVRALGAAAGSARSPEQTEIALFWADGAGTETPPGHWNSIAQDVAEQRNTTIEDNARLFALLNMAMADAAISAWDAKYTYNFWRPVTAIRSSLDAEWNSLIVTPPFPDYVSGHSAFSGAAATILAMFYRTDEIAFATGSDSLPEVTRHFPSFSAAAVEAAVSRLYGGIHFGFAVEDGLISGVQIGAWVFTNYLQPKGNRSRR